MVSYEGSNYGIAHTCRDKQVRVRRIGPEVLIMGSSGEIVSQHLMVPNRRMYFHPEQWPGDYRRDNRRGRRLGGYAIQKAGWDAHWMDGQPDISVYDDVMQGGF